MMETKPPKMKDGRTPEDWVAPLETVAADPKHVQKLLTKYDQWGRKRPAEEEEDLGPAKKSWKKLKEEKKELKRMRKEKAVGGNDKYILGVRAKKVWEELRQGNCKKARKEELSKELYTLIQGKMKSLIFAHDTVRVIETLVAVGGEKYRTLVFEEIKDELVNISKKEYARFLVLKMLRYGTRAQKDQVIASFKGKVVQMMKHKIASDVVELGFNDYANAKQRSMMMQEFYGPQFRLFHEDDIKCLGDVLKKYPEKREYVLKDMRKALQPIIDKGVFTNTMVHTLLRDFLTHCSVPDRAGIIEALKEGLAPIIHTRDGARVGMICLWHGTNKERKTILKSFRTHFVKIAKEEHGHMILLAAFDCMDDTHFMKKVVLSELIEDLDELVGSDSGLRVLRYLVAPRSPTFFQPSVVAVLAQGDGNEYSKKDTDIRERELQNVISAPLLRLLLANIGPWAVNTNWTLFIGAALKTLDAPEQVTIFHKLAEMLAHPYQPGMEGHILELAHSTKMLTYIIKCDQERHKADKPTFSAVVLKTVGDEAISWLGSNRGCFLLATMMETEIQEVVFKVKQLILPQKTKLAGMSYKGAEVLLKKLN